MAATIFRPYRSPNTSSLMMTWTESRPGSNLIKKTWEKLCCNRKLLEEVAFLSINKTKFRSYKPRITPAWFSDSARSKRLIKSAIRISFSKLDFWPKSSTLEKKARKMISWKNAKAWLMNSATKLLKHRASNEKNPSVKIVSSTSSWRKKKNWWILQRKCWSISSKKIVRKQCWI